MLFIYFGSFLLLLFSLSYALMFSFLSISSSFKMLLLFSWLFLPYLHYFSLIYFYFHIIIFITTFHMILLLLLLDIHWYYYIHYFCFITYCIHWAEADTYNLFHLFFMLDIFHYFHYYFSSSLFSAISSSSAIFHIAITIIYFYMLFLSHTLFHFSASFLRGLPLLLLLLLHYIRGAHYLFLLSYYYYWYGWYMMIHIHISSATYLRCFITSSRYFCHDIYKIELWIPLPLLLLPYIHFLPFSFTLICFLLRHISSHIHAGLPFTFFCHFLLSSSQDCFYLVIFRLAKRCTFSEILAFMLQYEIHTIFII